jgi:hypothetical protein
MGKRVELEADFKTEYIPLPLEMADIRRASLLLLLDWIMEDFLSNPNSEGSEVDDEDMVSDRVGDDRGVRTALFPMAGIAERKKTPKARGIYAWFIGHDGSVHRMAMGTG